MMPEDPQNPPVPEETPPGPPSPDSGGDAGEGDPLSRLLAEMDEHEGADMAPVLTQSVPAIPASEADEQAHHLTDLLSQPEPLVEEGTTPPPSTLSKPALDTAPEELKRLLRLRVPFQVMLAEKRERFSDVIAFQIGTLIEFSKLSDELLEVQVNEQPIGLGEVVKVQEKFGVRIKSMADKAVRIRSLAK